VLHFWTSGIQDCKMATTTEKVTEKVSEVLLGTTEEPGLSKDDRAIFQHFAKKDENGDDYLDEEQFVNAIAPQSEDYVSEEMRKYNMRGLELTCFQ